jgi:hypothetical protein
MKRQLNFSQGIISGDIVRSIVEVFPVIEDRFRQRKTYDEYYFDGATVEVTIEAIQSLNDSDMSVEINWEEIKINS